jgi:hypothetical protein
MIKNNERKLTDRRISLARLRTVFTQTPETVVGGREYLTFTLHDVITSRWISGEGAS